MQNENYKSIKLDKGMYLGEGTFSEKLAAMDPDEDYIGTPLEGLDAFQRQLKRFDIRAAGAGSDRVEKFFRTSDSAALFPEYVSRMIRTGMDENSVLGDITAGVTDIDSPAYRAVNVSTTKAVPSYAVNEGSALPETTIALSSGVVNMKKRGSVLNASYEAIRYQKLDVFSIALKRVGAAIAKEQLEDAIATLIGSSEDPSTQMEFDTAAEADYYALVDFWASFHPYTLGCMIVSPRTAAAIMKMPQFFDSAAGLSFHASGRPVTPLGAKLIMTASCPDEMIIGLDPRCALEMIRLGGVITEHDKLIDRQLERATISSTTGFSKIYNDASRGLNI